jgi:HK97 family phage major capsid protein
MLGRLTLELVQKRGPLAPGELLKLKSLRAEMDSIESDIVFDENRKYHDAFRRGLKFGFTRGLNEADRAIIHNRNAALRALETERERRDMQIGILGGAYTAAPVGGGLLVPLEFASVVYSALRDTGPMFRLATTIFTPTGALRSFVEENDSLATGERVIENESATIEDVQGINQVMLGAHKYGSRMVRVSTSLAQDFGSEDLGMDLETYLGGRFAVRIARIANTDFTLGTGVVSGNAVASQPMGFITAASSAGTAVGAGAQDGISGANSLEHFHL